MTPLLLFMFDIFPYWKDKLKSSQRILRRDTYMYLYRFPQRCPRSADFPDHWMGSSRILRLKCTGALPALSAQPSSPLLTFLEACPLAAHRLICTSILCDCHSRCRYKDAASDICYWTCKDGWKAVGCRKVSASSTTMPPALTENYR